MVRSIHKRGEIKNTVINRITDFPGPTLFRMKNSFLTETVGSQQGVHSQPAVVAAFVEGN